MVGFRKNFRKYRNTVYLDRVQRIIPKLWSSFEVSGSGTPVNERTSQSDMENVAYNFYGYNTINVNQKFDK